MANVEKLYINYEVLAEAKDKIAEHEAEYVEILAAIKGTTNEKRLASQFITRFFKNFPHLAHQAIDAQLDLCEDGDISIRKQAIKDLPSLCKDDREHLPKIADVLAQLLQTDDATELTSVHNSLTTLFKVDAKGTLKGLFSQILHGEEVVRERAIKFLAIKLKTLGELVITKDVEECLIEEIRKVLQDVTATEFVTFMSILSGLKMARLVPGQRMLVDIVAEQAELDKEFEHSEADSIDRLVQCIKQAQPYFSSQVPSTRFVDYMCTHVLPVLSEIRSPAEGVDLQLELLKVLAEMTTYCCDMSEDKTKLTIVFNKLMEYMPLPPSDENTENDRLQDDPKLEFSYVECLMYAFHQMAKRCPEFLTDEANGERLKDFKLRLQYFARGIQGYIKKLREALKGKNAEEMKTEENKIKVVALKTTSNINVLIRDLFHNPPSYKSNISLSWCVMAAATPQKQQQTAKVQQDTPVPFGVADRGLKRSNRTPITFGGEDTPPVKKVTSPISGPKGAQEIYTPPSGKYSDKVRGFRPGNRGGGRGGRGRAFRGRGWANRGFSSF